MILLFWQLEIGKIGNETLFAAIIKFDRCRMYLYVNLIFTRDLKIYSSPAISHQKSICVSRNVYHTLLQQLELMWFDTY